MRGHPKPLPIGADIALYAAPEEQRRKLSERLGVMRHQKPPNFSKSCKTVSKSAVDLSFAGKDTNRTKRR